MCVVSIFLHNNIVPAAITISIFFSSEAKHLFLLFYFAIRSFSRWNDEVLFLTEFKYENDCAATLNSHFEYLWVCVYEFQSDGIDFMRLFVLAHTIFLFDAVVKKEEKKCV